MADNKEYYGTNESKTFTFLEFGEVDTEKCTKKIWGFKLHQKAYDWFMLGRYANDILAFEKITKLLQPLSLQTLIDYYNSEIHHGDEASLSLSKNIALAVTQNNPIQKSPSFFELGQTIFGCIDGMDFYQAFLNQLKINSPQVNLKSVEWYGVDISEMFNGLSKTLHKEYRINAFVSTAELPPKMDVFFSKGITLLYAVRNLKDLFDTITRGRLAFFDYSFSLSEMEDTTIGSGKTVRYLKLSDFLSEIKKRKEKMYVKKPSSRFLQDTNRVWLDCLFAEDALCSKFIALDKKLRSEIADKLSGVKNSETFLNKESSIEWIPVSEFIESLSLK
jgi:hypothetical protein